MSCVAVLCIVACQPKPKPSAIPSAVQLTGSGDSYVELTAAVAPPWPGQGPCKDGMIVVAAGNGVQRLLMGSLKAPVAPSYDLAEWSYSSAQWVKLGSGTIDPPPTDATEAPEGSDSQSAHLNNGDLLIMWNGSTRSVLPDPKPDWWDDWGTPGNVPPAGLMARFPDGKRNGARAAQILWRYSCAQGKWLQTRMLDGGRAKALAPDGTAKAGHCVKGGPWVGGFDRPEMYVDPWGVDPSDSSKQRIYIASSCLRPDGDNSGQLFMSPDSGETWNPSGIRLSSDTPIVMTTTKNGRLFLLQPSIGGGPLLHWSDDHGASLASPAGGYDVSYVVPNAKPGEQAKFVVDWVKGSHSGVGQANAATLSLARTGKNAVMAVYPSIEVVIVNGKPVIHQVAAVVWIVTKAAGEAPIVVPITIVRAQAPDGSVLMPAFIQDDRLDASSNVSFLYWLETTSLPATGTDPVTMIARYMIFKTIFPEPAQMLSDAAGWENRNRTAYEAVGDYMKGSSYLQNGALSFVPVWPQVPPTVPGKDETQVFTRIITVRPGSAGAEPRPEGMLGAKQAPLGSSATIVKPPRCKVCQ